MESIKVGWIGTGVMGLHQAMHLQNKTGVKDMLVYNRTEAKADALVKNGARFVSP